MAQDKPDETNPTVNFTSVEVDKLDDQQLLQTIRRILASSRSDSLDFSVVVAERIVATTADVVCDFARQSRLPLFLMANLAAQALIFALADLLSRTAALPEIDSQLRTLQAAYVAYREHNALRERQRLRQEGRRPQ